MYVPVHAPTERDPSGLSSNLESESEIESSSGLEHTQSHSDSLSALHLPCNDIGSLLDPTVPTDPVYRAVSNLSNGEKYNLLYHHLKPPTVLTSTNVQGKNRKFNVSWLEKYSWLLYSPKVDGVFCGPCSILLSSSDRADKGLLVNKPLSNWEKLSNTLSSHSSLRYHRDCVLKVDVLKTTVEIPSSYINVMINSSLQKMNE